MKKLLLLAGLFSSMANATNIQPDKPQRIEISAKDVNRVTCVNGMVEDVFFSEEKIQQVTVAQDKVFLKLPIKQDGESLTYATNTIDFDIICDGQAYKFFAEPRENLRGQIIYLGDPQVNQALKNLQILDGMDVEDQYVVLVDAIMSNGRLNNHVFSALTKEEKTEQLILNQRPLRLQQSYRFNGAGLRIKHYLYPGKPGDTFREEQFLIPQISSRARAITVHPLTVTNEGFVNVVVIEEVY